MRSSLRSAPATTDTYTLSLHDALPISREPKPMPPPDPEPQPPHPPDPNPNPNPDPPPVPAPPGPEPPSPPPIPGPDTGPDRKSTRLNSSHLGISYAVFCLKKKNIYRHK